MQQTREAAIPHLDHAIVLLCAALALVSGCAGRSRSEPTAAPVTVAEARMDPPPTSEPAQLSPLTDEELDACNDETSAITQRAMAGDFSAGSVLVDRAHARVDMTRLCAAAEARRCFAERSAHALVACLDRHYCPVLRDHGTRSGVAAMRGADDPSKVVILRAMMRDGGVTDCALLGELERRASP